MKKIKKNWLISLIVINLYTLAYTFIVCSKMSLPTVNIPNFSTIFYSITIAFLLIFAIGSGYLGYYFGCKKGKTKWLSFVLIVRSISLLAVIVHLSYYAFTTGVYYYFSQNASILKTSTSIYFVTWLISIGLNLFYMYRTNELRKSNIDFNSKQTA